MKKIICIICMTLLLCGCQDKMENIEQGQSYTIQEKMSIEVIKTIATQRIEPSNKNAVSQSIQAKEDYIYIDVLLKTTNLSQEQLKIDEIFSGRYEVNGISYDLNSIMETVYYTGLTSTDTLKENEERYVHIYCEIPKDMINQEIILYLQILNSQSFQYSFIIDEETESKDNIQSIGDVLALKQSQITLNNLAQSKKIEPSNKGIFYSYIPVENENETYVYLQMDINNISNQTINPKEYIYCEYHVNDEIITSQIIIESENHKSLGKTGKIEPSQTRTLYLVMSVNDDWLKQKGHIEVFVEGQTFQVQV